MGGSPGRQKGSPRLLKTRAAGPQRPGFHTPVMGRPNTQSREPVHRGSNSTPAVGPPGRGTHSLAGSRVVRRAIDGDPIFSGFKDVAREQSSTRSSTRWTTEMEHNERRSRSSARGGSSTQPQHPADTHPSVSRGTSRVNSGQPRGAKKLRRDNQEETGRFVIDCDVNVQDLVSPPCSPGDSMVRATRKPPRPPDQ